MNDSSKFMLALHTCSVAMLESLLPFSKPYYNTIPFIFTTYFFQILNITLLNDFTFYTIIIIIIVR